ncbi:MAG: 50S ribosomal protein L5 [Candidatus Omnitrophota bacterium]
MKPRLLEKYRNEIVPAMKEKFGYKNSLQVPRIKKVTINMGIGKGAQDMKLIEDAQSELSIIAGQRPVVTRAKKDISNFKIRQGSAVGCAVTLRRAYMYEFLDRLINVALPRIRDFRGISLKSFDKEGNYSLGLREHTIFPELDIDKITNVKGMTVTIAIGNGAPDKSCELLKMFGFPFQTKA